MADPLIPTPPHRNIEIHATTGHAFSTKTAMALPAPTPLTEFTFFPKLPAEVQLEIWAAATPGIRSITITLDENQNAVKVEGYDRKGLLEACSDSRNAMVKAYKPVVLAKSGKPLYIDFAKDIFEFKQIGDLPCYLPFRRIGNVPPSFVPYDVESRKLVRTLVLREPKDSQLSLNMSVALLDKTRKSWRYVTKIYFLLKRP